MSVDQVLTYVAFFIMAGITLLGGLLVVAFRNILHAALALMLSFVGVAGIYVVLEAEFVAAAQVLIYVGAISILIIFAIMLTRGLMKSGEPSQNSQWIAAAAVSLLLFAVLFFVAIGTAWPLAQTTVNTDLVPKIGNELMTTYVFPFEIASLLLLAALVGAIVIARE
jgi:NADH:ubiquinone oxidoreductase subunit 6 (subunit J)